MNHNELYDNPAASNSYIGNPADLPQSQCFEHHVFLYGSILEVFYQEVVYGIRIVLKTNCRNLSSKMNLIYKNKNESVN